MRRRPGLCDQRLQILYLLCFLQQRGFDEWYLTLYVKHKLTEYVRAKRAPPHSDKLELSHPYSFQSACHV